MNIALQQTRGEVGDLLAGVYDADGEAGRRRQQQVPPVLQLEGRQQRLRQPDALSRGGSNTHGQAGVSPPPASH